MAEYYVAWCEEDNPECVHERIEYRDPTWFRVWRVQLLGRDNSVTPPMTQKEANEMLRKIKLLDPPAQKELELWQ